MFSKVNAALFIHLCFFRYFKVDKEEGESSATHLSRKSFKRGISLASTGNCLKFQSFLKSFRLREVSLLLENL